MSRFWDDYFDQGYNDDNPMPVDVLISIMQDMKNRQEGNALPDTIGAEYYFLQDFITLDMDCDFPYIEKDFLKHCSDKLPKFLKYTRNIDLDARYNENPVEVAKEFEAHGIHRLHIVDLDGAASRHVVNYRVLDQIASRTSLVIDFGGGIKTDEDLVIAFDNGAQMVTLGSVAVKNPRLFKKWLEQYGNEKIILGADVKKNKISVNGWKEESQQQLIPFLKDYTKEGVFKVLCTDISRDGMLQGPSVELYQQILKEFPDMHLIASGGVSCIQDIIDLEIAKVPAVVFGKALYEGKITLKDLNRFM